MNISINYVYFWGKNSNVYVGIVIVKHKTFYISLLCSALALSQLNHKFQWFLCQGNNFIFSNDFPQQLLPIISDFPFLLSYFIVAVLPKKKQQTKEMAKTLEWLEHFKGSQCNSSKLNFWFNYMYDFHIQKKELTIISTCCHLCQFLHFLLTTFCNILITHQLNVL